jgi:periplasmic protein TonB
MSVKPRPVRGDSVGSLKGCLVEGDPEQRQRERGVRRRALAISITAQSAALAALILVPLLGKPARIALANVVPLPPYSAYREGRRAPDPTEPRNPRPPRNVCRFCAPLSIPNSIMTHDPQPPGDDGDPIPGIGEGPAVPGQIPLDDLRTGVKPPPPPQSRVEQPSIIRVTTIDPAMLTHRVEPVYPALARQIARSGRVELRAIIATDGTIQSVEVVGGDPLFYQSALEAVRQWRYSPTVLNGKAVEVDTHIDVIYTMQR